nr:hypothetical protein Iba_scaffold57964CG0010 [Ipomoea batatas]GMD22749.1 hypothetical protein Iba_chr08aCG13760 [Ipomoea batatas]
MEDSSIGNGAARIDTDEYMTMNCLFKRIAVRGVRLRNLELSAAAMVMVTGVLCCDGDGDATGNTATRSTLLRQQVLSAAVATSSLLRWQRALLQKNQQRRALLQWLSDVDEVTFGDGTETATAGFPYLKAAMVTCDTFNP